MSASNKSRLQKMRTRYTVIIWLVAILCLALGVAAGIFVERNILSPDTTVTPVVTPEAVIIEEPEETPEPEADEAAPETANDIPGWSDDVEAEPVESEEPAEVIEETDAAAAEATETVPEVPVETAEETAAAVPGTDEQSIMLTDAAATAEIPAETPAPTPEPTPEPREIIAYGDTFNFNTQIDSTGLARLNATEDPFETLQFSLKMTDYMDPAIYNERYSNMYPVNGNEAGAEFELVLIDYTGEAQIVPQNIINIKLVSESGNTESSGYQLMDAMAGGGVNVALKTNTPTKLYKRFDYVEGDEAYKYMLVEIFNDGVTRRIFFEMQPEKPKEELVALKKHDKSDAVVRLQTKLIELGYLEGDADGDFGSKTEAAIKLAQKDMEMEETGEASVEFLEALYARTKE